ncbi:MAG: hypothetical protein J6L03_05605 [Bacteroidaceae bacterium]|nr:hypothetical protein [Bacteroidaceae bacterium]
MATKGITLKAKLADGVEHQLMPKTRIEMVVNSNGETLTTILAAMKTAIEKGYESIVVRHDTAQVLEAAQKLQARKNIDAVGVTATYGTDAIVLEFKDKSYYPETKTDYVKYNSQVTLTELLDSMQVLISGVKANVDTFLADADTTAAARDTLKELQEYINSDATAGAQMLADINELKNKTSKSVYVKTQDTGHGAVLANNISGEEEYIYPQTKAENVLLGNGSDLATVVTTMNSALSNKPDRTEFRTVNGRSIFKVEGESTDIDLGNIVYYSEVIDL